MVSQLFDQRRMGPGQRRRARGRRRIPRVRSVGSAADFPPELQSGPLGELAAATRDVVQKRLEILLGNSGQDFPPRRAALVDTQIRKFGPRQGALVLCRSAAPGQRHRCQQGTGSPLGTQLDFRRPVSRAEPHPRLLGQQTGLLAAFGQLAKVVKRCVMILKDPLGVCQQGVVADLGGAPDSLSGIGSHNCPWITRWRRAASFRTQNGTRRPHLGRRRWQYTHQPTNPPTHQPTHEST